MKTILLYSFSIIFLLLNNSCGSKTAENHTAVSNATSSTSNTPSSTSSTSNKPTETVIISFLAKALPEDKETQVPYAEIFFTYSSTTKNAEIVVATKAMGEYNLIDKNDYAKYKIPVEAKAGIAGFWAGLGTAFYAIEKDDKILVFEGFQDEGMPEYTYKEVKNFAPKKLVQ